MWAFSRFVRYFGEAAARGSMRRAGEELHVSPSSVDRQILRVEEELGIPLFERLPQGLKVTAAGELVLFHLKNWRREMDLLKGQIEDLKGLRRGHIVLAVVEGAIEWITPILGEFHAKYPGVSYEIHIHGADHVARLVIDNSVDIGLSMNPPILPGLVISNSAEFRLGVITPPNHPIAERKSVHLSDCLEHGVIIPDTSLALRGVIDRLLATSSAHPKVSATSNSLSMLKHLVRQNIGIGLVTKLDATWEIENGILRFISLDDRNVHPSRFSICLAADRQLSTTTAALLTYIDNAMSIISPSASTRGTLD